MQAKEDIVNQETIWDVEVLSSLVLPPIHSFVTLFTYSLKRYVVSTHSVTGPSPDHVHIKMSEKSPYCRTYRVKKSYVKTQQWKLSNEEWRSRRHGESTEEGAVTEPAGGGCGSFMVENAGLCPGDGVGQLKTVHECFRQRDSQNQGIEVWAQQRWRRVEVLYSLSTVFFGMVIGDDTQKRGEAQIYEGHWVSCGGVCTQSCEPWEPLKILKLGSLSQICFLKGTTLGMV